MGEKHTTIAFGVFQSSMPECPGPYEPGDEDNNWLNWSHESEHFVKRGYKIGLMVGSDHVCFGSSYEADPPFIGFEAEVLSYYTTFKWNDPSFQSSIALAALA